MTPRCYLANAMQAELGDVRAADWKCSDCLDQSVGEEKVEPQCRTIL